MVYYQFIIITSCFIWSIFKIIVQYLNNNYVYNFCNCICVCTQTCACPVFTQMKIVSIQILIIEMSFTLTYKNKFLQYIMYRCNGAEEVSYVIRG